MKINHSFQFSLNNDSPPPPPPPPTLLGELFLGGKNKKVKNDHKSCINFKNLNMELF